jgi:predicted nucleic acid-binding protein
MYLDSAVLVKLFVREPDSEFFGKMTDGEAISSSVLAYTEVWSAFLAKERAAGISPEQRRRAWAAFRHNVDEELIELLTLTPAIFKRANRILEQCQGQVPLRSLDALNLASCDQLQDWPLCTTDKQMRAATALLHFPLTPLA